MKEYFLVSCLALLSSVWAQDRQCGAGNECIGSDKCDNFKKAKEVLISLTRGTDEREEQLNYLKSLICNKELRKVCCVKAGGGCPESPDCIPSLDKEECGIGGDTAEFVLGGEDTKIGEFPFVALLGNGSADGTDIFWHCGGALINKWYVLSAAHCKPPQFIRLGEWKVEDDETEKRDCVKVAGGGRKKEVCTEPHQDIPVAEVKIHPGYTRTKKGLAVHDVMLVKLSRPAEYNNFVQPVCLPDPGLSELGEPSAPVFGNNRATIVGWGKTNNGWLTPVSAASTDIQQKVELPTVDNGECSSKWEGHDLRANQILCAGGVEGKDSCKGDSGGPLMAQENDFSAWQLVGVVSGGTNKCGIGAPGIYARVTHYLQWIRDNLN